MSTAENQSKGCFCKHAPPPPLLSLDSEEEEVYHQSESVFLLLISYMAASCLSPSGIREQEEEASLANA